MNQHSSNALQLAEWLQQHDSVEHVNYPGLATHPHHELAKRQMSDFGGMLSFELTGGVKAGIRFMKKITFCTHTATLGTADTLIQHPASTSHLQVSREQRLAGGITDGLIRMSVGIEDVDDVISDLKEALT